MEVVKNITHDKFPTQSTDLGKIVNIMMNNENVKATVVRSDSESPNKVIYRTENRIYLYDNESENFSLPEQGSLNALRTEVCFHYDTDNILEGLIVRDDRAKPHHTMIHLDDGRVVSAIECQYSPKTSTRRNPEMDIENNPYIIQLRDRLSKFKNVERAKELHGIYKQIVPSRKDKTTLGFYYVLSHNTEKVFFDIPLLVNHVVQQTRLNQFYEFIANEMSKYSHMKKHSIRLKEIYSRAAKINIRNLGTTLS